MKKNKQLLFNVIVIFLMYSCGYIYDDGRCSLVAGQKSFFKLYERQDLFAHFPEYDREKPTMGFITTLIPTNRKGNIFQYEYFDKDNKNVNDLKKHKVLYHTNYNDNIIIDFGGFRDSLIKRPECNNYFKDKYPLPDLGYVNLSLGTLSNKIVGAHNKMYDIGHSIYPSDLEIYVVDAKAGNFWKTKSDKENPESLKEWKYGYSRGYAISESQQRIIYWTKVW